MLRIFKPRGNIHSELTTQVVRFYRQKKSKN
nr:MAG TPA: hypothetical protein [Caudoviricetes sp.]